MKPIIKTIALDMDGTLIDSNRDIQPKTKEALIQLQEKGIHVILASGRPLKSMLKDARELHLDKHYGIVLSYNGGAGYDIVDERFIFKKTIDRELTSEILELIEDESIHAMLENGDFMVVEDAYSGVVDTGAWGKGKQNIMKFEASMGDYQIMELRPLKDKVDFEVTKVLTIVEPKILQEKIKKYKKIFDGRLHVVQTSPFYMEFVSPEVNKAYGLKQLNIDPETLLTFGDSMNDKEMLEYSKYSVAMGNAQQEIKDIVTYVTDSSDDEGIYKALKHFGLIE